MGISYAPSALEQLGGPGAVEQLGEAVAKIVNPDYKYQQTMRTAIASHPELAQSLADLEANAPGTLKAMHLGPLADTISKIPESPDNQVARTHREQILGIKSQDVANTAAEGKVKATDIKNKGDIGAQISNIIATDPKAAMDIARRAAGLPSVTEGKIQESEAVIKGNEATVSAAETPVKIDQADLARQDLEKIRAQYPTLSGVDVNSVANDLAAGKSVPNLNLLMQVDGFSKALPMALRAREMEMARANTRAIHQQTMEMQQNRIDSTNERAKERAADQQSHMADMEYLKSNGRGSAQGWLTAIQTPGAVQAAIDKAAKNPEDMTQDDWDLVDIGKFQKERNQAQTDADAAKASRTARGVSQDFDKDVKTLETLTNPGAGKAIEPTLVSAKLADINQKLLARNKQTGRNIKLNYGKIPGSGFLGVGPDKTDLYYTDNGKVIDYSEAQSYMSSDAINKDMLNKSGTATKLSDKSQQFLDIWNTMTPQQKMAARGTYADKDEYKELNAKGLLK